MPTTFRPYEPDDKVLLLAPDVREWLPAVYLAHHVGDLVDGLDLTAFYAPYELPEELRRREDRLAAIRAAKERLEAAQREADDAHGRLPRPEPQPQGREAVQARLRGTRGQGA